MTKTSTTKETYAYVGYKGTLGSENCLGVNELKNYTSLKAKLGGTLKSPSKYIRWLVYKYFSNILIIKRFETPIAINHFNQMI